MKRSAIRVARFSPFLTQLRTQLTSITVLNCMALIALGFLVCGCPPGGDPPTSKYINVPFIRQENSSWCSAACVKMWVKYLIPTFDRSQAEIAAITGNMGAENPSAIVQALKAYAPQQLYSVREFSYPEPGDPNTLNYWQDTLMGAQGSCLEGNRPSIPIVYGDRYPKHAVVWTGYKYIKAADGHPIIQEVRFHDPDSGADQEWLIDSYKTSVFVPYWYNNNQVHTVVMEWCGSGSPGGLISAAQSYLAEFVRRRGTFRGGPRIYDPNAYDRYPRRVK